MLGNFNHLSRVTIITGGKTANDKHVFIALSNQPTSLLDYGAEIMNSGVAGVPHEGAPRLLQTDISRPG